jgi:hypothetical protein
MNLKAAMGAELAEAKLALDEFGVFFIAMDSDLSMQSLPGAIREDVAHKITVVSPWFLPDSFSAPRR